MSRIRIGEQYAILKIDANYSFFTSFLQVLNIFIEKWCNIKILGLNKKQVKLHLNGSVGDQGVIEGHLWGYLGGLGGSFGGLFINVHGSKAKLP